MKTRFILASFALAALAFAGCTKNVITKMPTPAEENTVVNGDGAPIKFSTYVPQTPDMKGPETTLDVVKAGFGISAAYTEGETFAAATDKTPDFMCNQKVTFDGTSWTYSPLKYWPTAQTDRLSFFAYAPYNGAGITLCNNASGDASVLNFAIQDPASSTVDFVAAAKIDEIGGDDPGTVKFQLKHELTRMTFVAKASETLLSSTGNLNKTKLVITDIRLTGSDKSGKPEKYMPSNKVYANADYTYADEAVGTWSNLAPRATEYQLSGDMVAMPAVTLGASGYSQNGVALEGTATVNLFGDNNYLYLIPVAGGISSTSDVVVAFTYEIVTEDASLAKGYSQTKAVKYVSLPDGTLLQGKSYKFTFTFEVDALVVEAGVDGWGDDALKDGDVDYTDPL